jgi:hypothetical protein
MTASVFWGYTADVRFWSLMASGRRQARVQNTFPISTTE